MQSFGTARRKNRISRKQTFIWVIAGSSLPLSSLRGKASVECELSG
jgi:hypothetical protein